MGIWRSAAAIRLTLSVLHGPTFGAANAAPIDIVAILPAVGLRAVIAGTATISAVSAATITAAAITTATVTAATVTTATVTTAALITRSGDCRSAITAASAASHGLAIGAWMVVRDNSHPAITGPAIRVDAMCLRTRDRRTNHKKRCA